VLGPARDALFESGDAVLLTLALNSFVELATSPVFRQRWPSAYEASQDSRPDRAALLDVVPLLTWQLLLARPAAADKPLPWQKAQTLSTLAEKRPFKIWRTCEKRCTRWRNRASLASAVAVRQRRSKSR